MDELELQLPSPLAELDDERLAVRGVRLFLKRDDLIHPDLPGNKWRKLKYNLSDAQRMGSTQLLTFGGAYSNHIRAVAAAGYHFGFKTVGIIRGEEHLPLNESLQYAVDKGMTLTYLDRTSYRDKRNTDLLERLQSRFGEFYLIPEGGSNVQAVPGCRELVREIDVDFDVITCACGTGGTLAGAAAASRSCCVSIVSESNDSPSAHGRRLRWPWRARRRSRGIRAAGPAQLAGSLYRADHRETSTGWRRNLSVR
ncbi:pyridoxal-phosphate dependent enzyme [Herbihabitans rhizosphaerae]|uniref:Pyridoxal-phosphate dependent enzyme n=1 Tax=Herbihabitans rhizosphaerae TaxID=1872711 RepID=A0A4Q7KQA5_9PSEU|nr:pyridoxal-phosphate dependent enzyme [Herbihabitans rhizosphaerae]RZS39008.1 pyridoxal-phosphate dependent enzyme [Herbihabitans rhizosphaerae]